MKTSGWRNAMAQETASTGTPDGKREHRLNHLIGQIRRRDLDGLPRMGSLGLQLGLGLAHGRSGSLAGSVECSFALGVALFCTLLAQLVDFGARLAKLVSVFGCSDFC